MPVSPESTGFRLLGSKGTVRLADIEQKIAVGHFEPTPETLDKIKRYTIGLLHALEEAIVIDSSASS